MRSQIRSLTVAARNAEDGISLVQTAEAEIGQILSLFHRMRGLAVRSLNDTLSVEDRGTLTTEFTELAAEILRRAVESEFNGIALMPTNQTIDIQVGTQAGETIGVDLIRLPFLGTVLGSLTLNTDAESTVALNLLDGFHDVLTDQAADLGSTQNRLQSAIASIRSRRENLTAAESRIRDADMATEVANLARASILQEAGVAVLAQANAEPALTLLLLA